MINIPAGARLCVGFIKHELRKSDCPWLGTDKFAPEKAVAMPIQAYQGGLKI